MLAAVALGANLGDRLGTLRGAVLALGRIGELAAVSPLFETDPVGPEQPDYLNAAVLLRYEGSPRQLLEAVLDIERSFGRERRERWGPRTLDLDILWIDGVMVADPDLTIPHARLPERRFALEPLLAIAPDAAHPVSGEPYRGCVDRLPTGGIRRIADADWAGAVQVDGKASETTRSAV
jgi:2-amino-4-hydroxy-6-hydroxymethyldihydropteridine diphosphokinase